MNLLNLDVAIMLVLLMIGMYVPDMIQGVRNYHRGRDLARRITQEHDARRFLDEQWKTQ
jgi:hypothetical protein